MPPSTTTYQPRYETLVAIDWEGTGRSIQPVLDYVARHGEHVLANHWSEPRAHPTTGLTQNVHYVTFDARQVRNTEVHGAGYRAGFVVHIE